MLGRLSRASLCMALTLHVAVAFVVVAFGFVMAASLAAMCLGLRRGMVCMSWSDRRTVESKRNGRRGKSGTGDDLGFHMFSP